MSKQIYTWSQVEAGDIISFRYKGKNPTGTLTSLLVMNPKMPFVKKDGSRTFHLIGLKLESQGSVPIIKNKGILEKLLSKLGTVRVVDFKDEIYKVVIEGADSKGAKKISYDKIKRQVEKLYDTSKWCKETSRGNWDKRNIDMYDGLVMSLFEKKA